VSYLSEALATLAEEKGRGFAKELAGLTGISQPQMSRYFAGTNLPPDRNIGRICDALPERDRIRIAIAFVRDRLPDSARDLVSILAEPAPEGSAAFVRELEQIPMSMRLQETILYLARAAVRYAEVAESLHSTARLLRGQLLAVQEDPLGVKSGPADSRHDTGPGSPRADTMILEESLSRTTPAVPPHAK
jgi:transcriptional regulator with XRE-family HTH domain